LFSKYIAFGILNFKSLPFQVASFLHHQEKMNVLVEPDVHDTFARIPGYGFVQTFYTQDTRYKVSIYVCDKCEGAYIFILLFTNSALYLNQ
jgi:hypothetical protein